MTEDSVLEQLSSLQKTVARLQKRVEDLEDLRDLENAIVENGNQPFVSWDAAKKQLDLD